MTTRRLLPLAAIAGSALFILFAAVPAAAPPHRLHFVFVFLYCVILPGYTIVDRFLPWARGFVRALASLVMGTALFFAILFCVVLLRRDIAAVGFILPPLILALAILRGREAAASPPGDAEEAAPPAGPLHTMIMLALLVAVSAVILRTGDPLYYTSDSVDHIAYIRAIARTHDAFPGEWYYRDGGILTHDIRKGMLHSLWGTLNVFTGRTEALPIWPLISLIGSVFFLIAIYCSGTVLFRSPAIGVLSVILCVLFYRGGLRGLQLITVAYGFLFGKIYYLGALSFVPLFMRTGRARYLWFAAAAAATAAFAHINFLWMMLFILGVFWLASAIHRRGVDRAAILWRRLPHLALAILALAGPYVALRFIRDYAPSNPIHQHVQGTLFLTQKWYVLNPVVFFWIIGPLGGLASISVILLWNRARTDETLRLLLYGIIAFYVLVFNPLWFPLLHDKMLYLLMRFEFIVPTMTLSAYLLAEAYARLRRCRRDLDLGRAAIAMGAAALLLGVPLGKTPRECVYAPRSLAARQAESYYAIHDCFRFLDQECPPRSVVLSDPITSFGVPAFTDAYVVCTFDQHAIPNDSTARDRIADCRTVFTPTSSFDEVRRILERYDAGYIVVNGRIPPGILTLYWKPTRETARAVRERLLSLRPSFAPLYDENELTVFRYTGVPPENASIAGEMPLPFLGDSLSEAAVSRFDPSGIGGVSLAGAEPSRSTVRRGDTLRVRVDWIATQRLPLQRYNAYLRFDTKIPAGALYHPVYGKPYRKALEKVNHRRYRFRVDFQPLRGIYPPDTWRLMREIRDTVLVRVPADIAPGAYDISVKLAVKPQFPNYRVGDILTDDDYYAGVVLAHIVIE